MIYLKMPDGKEYDVERTKDQINALFAFNKTETFCLPVPQLLILAPWM